MSLGGKEKERTSGCLQPSTPRLSSRSSSPIESTASGTNQHASHEEDDRSVPRPLRQPLRTHDAARNALVEAGYAVAVALIDLTMDQDVALAAAVDRVASAKPSVTIHRLPRIQNPPAIMDCGGDALLWYFKTVKRYNDRLREFLSSLQQQQPPRSVVHAVIVDGPSADALDVTKELGVPAYTFYTTNASAVAVFLQLPWTHAEGQQPSFKELGDTRLSISGVPPMPVSYLMPSMLHDPATGDGDADGETKERHECLAWLDEQPERSVVFLCFGSLGSATHSAKQLKEIAVGLERSGHRFLWVVQAPLPTEGIDPV
ncbi:unnamed protein product [Miscanthus lutarioriparius]|uniref:Uncharacterized protein n=1 Tax=Miscanthus lutarioriparius TaxID=422564 RepID=A0A811NJ52_9POAL|nr:unnamed protein product [Miscanthus lutarioriparius]